MTGDKSKFLSLEERKPGMVSFGGGQKGQIKGIGKIGKTSEHSIKNVYHVGVLNHNLRNISKLCDKVNKVISSFIGVEVIKLETKGNCLK